MRLVIAGLAGLTCGVWWLVDRMLHGAALETAWQAPAALAALCVPATMIWVYLEGGRERETDRAALLILGPALGFLAGVGGGATLELVRDPHSLIPWGWGTFFLSVLWHGIATALATAILIAALMLPPLRKAGDPAT